MGNEILQFLAEADAKLAERKHDVEFEEMDIPAWPAPPAPEAFYGLPGEVVKALEPHTEADPVALLINFLVAFGNVIGRNATFDVAGEIHTTTLFALLVGGTSEGRKGTSWAIIKRLFSYVDPDWAKFKTPNGLSTGEGLIWAIRDPIRKWDPKQQMEVVVDAGVADKRLMVVESEFAQALKVMQREGNTLSPIIRAAWDGHTLQSLTKNNTAVATNPHVSILGQITPTELQTLLNSTEKFNGFANRFLIVCVRRSKYLSNPPVLEEAKLKRLAGAILDVMPKEPVVLHRTPDAEALWEEVYPVLANRGDDLVGVLTSRAEAQVLRLSMVYALADGKQEIEPQHILAALALWEYVEASTKFVFGAADCDPITTKIVNALKERPLTQTELYREVFKCNVPAKRIAIALQNLAARGKIQATEEINGRRPTRRWSLIC